MKMLLLCVWTIAAFISGPTSARPSVFPDPYETNPSPGLNPTPDASGISVLGESPILDKASAAVPVFSVSNSSKEGIDIANRINHLFKNLDSARESNPEPGEPDRRVATDLNQVLAANRPQEVAFPGQGPDSGNTSLRLNLNLDVEVENGKPKKLLLPHGQLVVMFLPRRGGGAQKSGKTSALFGLKHLLHFVPQEVKR